VVLSVCHLLRFDPNSVLPQVKDHYSHENGAYGRAVQSMRERGVTVDVCAEAGEDTREREENCKGKTKSPPLNKPYIVIGTLGDNW
jgi:hypothetical protein